MPKRTFRIILFTKVIKAIALYAGAFVNAYPCHHGFIFVGYNRFLQGS
jgi:hypothetical protein